MEKVETMKMDPETEFLASKQETGHEWELYKENVRPLKRGRNVRLLNDALKSHTDIQLKKSLLHNRRYPHIFISFVPNIFMLIRLIAKGLCCICHFWLNVLLWLPFSLSWIGFRRLIEAIDEYKGDDPLQPWLQWVICFSLSLYSPLCMYFHN